MTANAPEQLEWSGKNGAEERFFCMTAEPGASFEEELHSLMTRYRNLGGGEEDEFLLRFHVSDPVRQSAALRRMIGERNSYVSMVGQPPANGARVALEAWHIGGMLGKRHIVFYSRFNAHGYAQTRRLRHPWRRFSLAGQSAGDWDW